MEKESKFSWKKRGKAFVYAWQGFRALLRYEHNARIHLVAAVLAICAGIIFSISAMEWCVVVMCIGVVIAAEALNSAVEALADKISPEYDPLIGKAKDLGATAVTLLALVAAVVGCIVYLPYIIRWFS
ncbi:MAG: diacylglycerol kinase family protein [Muribaculaceae bacterium]|nr:diacylglycerol kinase family protein [Muribaculaceae bacterium]MDE6794005.1 diacylglycerol kinase family protein [Muribaculaceae bacterium]